MLKILIDTNILLPLEPTSLNDVESLSHQANEFVQKTQKAKALIYLLDVQKNDINRDKDENRRNLRLLACEKYQLLTNVQMSEFFKGNFELSNLNPHDFVDVSLLNALYCNAVSILVTNDNGIHSKAKKIGLGDRVYRLEDALDFINMQLPMDLKAESLHPIINREKCYNLDIHDDFFDSLRQDYDGFDDWFQEKCQRGHRDCFVIRNESKIAGLCIYKNEEPSYEMKGKIVKICTFKLKYSGTKQGELLLRQLFKMCYDSNVDWLYVTAFESNYICQFFEDFGFECYREKKEDTGELIYRRRMVPTLNDRNNLLALPFHKRFGYRYFIPSEKAFLVPTKENFYNRLFPETEIKGFDLFADKEPCSNAIRKAYICNSNSRLIEPGNILFFYRTHSDKKIECCGIVEQTLHSSKVDEILPLVGKRSVFSKFEIENFCTKGRDCFLILFRQVENLKNPCNLDELKERDFIKGYPQTITMISNEAKECILSHMLY
jgi:hypothetical protein